MIFCNSCILPNTRPNLIIDKDVYAMHVINLILKLILTGMLEKELLKIVNDAKNSSGYDCLIPVSGGKDSTWQVVECLKLGLKPLAVTWKTPKNYYWSTEL